MRQKLLAPLGAILLVSLAVLLLPSTAEADDLFTPGSTGYDISWPQCGGPEPATPFAFGIVGVTGGKPFMENPCLAEQYQWATRGGRQPSLYINLKSPVGTNAEEALTGPAGACQPNDEACLAYNFGYKSAQHAVAYAGERGAHATLWWLDIETMNTWSSNTAMNAVVIGAAIEYLEAQGSAVGIYSSPSQWREIAGDYSPGVPVWIAMAPNAAAAPSYCSRPYAGGEVHLVQYIVGGFDVNYACSAADRVPPPVVEAPPIAPAGSLAMVAADGDCLNVRAGAGLTASSTACLATGTHVTVLDGAQMADGYRWQRVSSGPLNGWVAAHFLRAIGAGPVEPTSVPTPVEDHTGTFAAPPVYAAIGQALAVYRGGSVDQLEDAALDAEATGVWAQDALGSYQLLIAHGPEFANAAFRAAFPAGFAGAVSVTLIR